MTDWRTLMREAGERDEADHLTSEEARAMRRTVVAAVADTKRVSSAVAWVRRPMVVASAAAAIALVALVAELRPELTNRGQVSANAVPAGSVDLGNRPNADEPNRQLQFLTPGGTRIIWVFNQQLQLEASLR